MNGGFNPLASVLYQTSVMPRSTKKEDQEERDKEERRKLLTALTAMAGPKAGTTSATGDYDLGLSGGSSTKRQGEASGGPGATTSASGGVAASPINNSPAIGAVGPEGGGLGFGGIDAPSGAPGSYGFSLSGALAGARQGAIGFGLNSALRAMGIDTGTPGAKFGTALAAMALGIPLSGPFSLFNTMLGAMLGSGKNVQDAAAKLSQPRISGQLDEDTDPPGQPSPGDSPDAPPEGQVTVGDVTITEGPPGSVGQSSGQPSVDVSPVSITSDPTTGGPSAPDGGGQSAPGTTEAVRAFQQMQQQANAQVKRKKSMLEQALEAAYP